MEPPQIIELGPFEARGLLWEFQVGSGLPPIHALLASIQAATTDGHFLVLLKISHPHF